MEGIVEVEAETSSCATVDNDIAAQQSGTADKPVKAKRKKIAACTDKSRSTCSGHIPALPASDEMIPGHIIAGPALGELHPDHTTAVSAPDQLLPVLTAGLPAPDLLVTPPVMKGNGRTIRTLVLPSR